MPAVLGARQAGPATVVVASEATQEAVDPNTTKLLVATGDEPTPTAQPSVSFDLSFDDIQSTPRPTSPPADEPPESATPTPTAGKDEANPIPLGAVIGVVIAVSIACVLLLAFFWRKQKAMKRARERERERRRNRAATRDPKVREGAWEEFKSGSDSLQEPFPGTLPSPSTICTTAIPTFVEEPTSPKRAATIKSVARVNPSNNFAVGSDDEFEDDRSLRMPMSPTSGRVNFRENIQRTYTTINPSHNGDGVHFPPPLPVHRDGAQQLTPQPKRTLTLRSHKAGNNSSSIGGQRSKETNMIALHNIIAALDSHSQTHERPTSLEYGSPQQEHSSSIGHAVDPFQDPEFVHNIRRALPKKSSK